MYRYPQVINIFTKLLFVVAIIVVIPAGKAFASTTVYSYNATTTSSNGTPNFDPNGDTPMQTIHIVSPISFDEIQVPLWLGGIDNSTEHATAGTQSVKIYSSSDGTTLGTLLATSQTQNATSLYSDPQICNASTCQGNTGGMYITNGGFKVFDFNSEISASAGYYIVVISTAGLTCADTGFPSFNNCVNYTRAGAYNNDSGVSLTGSVNEVSDYAHQTKFANVIMVSGAVVPPDTSTRIDTINPANNSTIATSSIPYTFETTGYVNPDDYVAGSRFMIKVDRNTDQQSSDALVGFNSAFGNKTYLPITASTSFDLATSSDSLHLDFPLRVGLYRVRWEIQSPKFSLFGLNFFYNTQVGLDSRFTVGTTTSIDNIQLQQEAYLQTIKDSTGDPLAACQFSLFDTALDFSLGGQLINCMGGIVSWLLIPSPDVLNATVQQLKDGFLTRPPIGYLTRIVSAIQGGTQGTLPDVSVDVPIPDTDNNHTGKITIGFDVNQWISDTADLENTFQDPLGHTAKQIIEPIIQLLVGLLVMMFIWNDLHRKLSRL